MAYITSEIPAGLINWVNTAYNTSQTWTSIIGVFKDWAEITAANYTYVWTLLTFATPPLFSVSIIYIVWTGFALNDWEILVPNSPLSWTINWVNKTFTVVSGWIKQVLSAVYDGAETRDFSFVPGSSTITFVNAPTAPASPIYIDYITYGSAADTNFVWNASQSDLLDRIYGFFLKEKTNSTIFKLDTTKQMINEIQDAICTGWYTDLNAQTFKSPNLTFLNKRSYYKVFPDTLIEENANSGSVSLKITNQYPTTGNLLINWNIVSYNWNNGLVISWVVWLVSDVTSWDKVKLIYWLPLDIYKWFSIKEYMGWYEYIIDEIDSRDNIDLVWFTKKGYFITEDYYNNKFVWFTWFCGNSTFPSKIEFNYIRKTPEISGTVNSIIPSPYAITIIPELVSARRLLVDEPTKAKNIETMWVNSLKRLYDNYADKTKEFRGVIESDNSFFVTDRL